MIKSNNRSLMIIVMIIIALTSIIFSVLIASIDKNHVYAEEMTASELLSQCKEMTEDVFIVVNNQTKNINNYSNYLQERFQLNNKFFETRDIADEWILQIVPIEVFKQKKEFFYIGNTYGFYCNYDSSTQKYLIYLIKNKFTYNNGLLTREVSPLYYEQYTFNEQTETVSLVYMDYYIYPDQNRPDYKIHYYHYRKHSDYEKLYLKDVNFTGSLYNENHLNIGESGYNPNQDNGGYFVESRYRFKGVSTQSGKTEFAGALLQIGLGYIPLGIGGLTVGDVLNVATAISELGKFANNAVKDFRGSVSNEDLYKQDQFGGMTRDNQINTYGNPLKTSATSFQTNNTKEAVLLGINSDAYAKNEYLINYYNQSNMWNTRFVWNVSLDIVKEVSTFDGSRVDEIANNLQAVTPNSYTLDNGEKTQLILDETQQLYILKDAKHKVRFTAPVNGIYTIKTMGNNKNDIIKTKGELSSIDNGINKKLVVNLLKDEILNFSVIKKVFGNTNLLDIIIEFTPSNIEIGQTQQIEIQPGGKEYLLFLSDHKALPFNFNITGTGVDEIAFQMAYNGYNNFLPNAITGKYLYGSRLAEYEGKYYLIISNLSNKVQTILVTLEEVRNVIPEAQIAEGILDRKVYALSSIFTSSVKISVASEAHILMQVFDVNHNLLSWTSNVSQKQLMCDVESGKSYYVVISNLLYANYSMELTFNLGGYTLSLGNNETAKSNEAILAKFTTQDAIADYEIESNLIFDIYDLEWNIISYSSDNVFSFEANTIYYIYASGLASNFQININLINTNETSGIFPASGIVFINYIPTRTTAYKVTGANEVQWYNSLLIRQNAYLYVGSNYLLRLEGNPGEEYNINILRNTNQIQTNASLTIAGGLYFFYIAQSATYTVWVTCPVTMSTNITIYNEFSETLYEDIQLLNESRDIYFEEGLYYLDFTLFNGNRASIRILTKPTENDISKGR